MVDDVALSAAVEGDGEGAEGLPLHQGAGQGLEQRGGDDGAGPGV